MSCTIDASKLLRPRLLDGVSIVLAGASGDRRAASAGLAAAVSAVCSGLGARVSDCSLDGGAPLDLDEAAIERAVDRALAGAGGVELLVVDGAGLFASVPGDGPADARVALSACLDASWNVTRAVANGAFLPGASGGRIVYLAPPADAGTHACAAVAGLENLARTLSIEWARHGITAVAIAPGAGAGAGMAHEVAALTAYLASPAGAYFSGCLLDLRGAGGACR
jgi:NAD(P)-dependent dehydrogenase (short-subunit alcohol dehydrogenase family)